MLAILIGGALLLLVLSWLAVLLLDPLVGSAVVVVDEAVLAWVQERMGGPLAVIAVEVTYLGSALVAGVIVLVAALLLWVQRLRVAAFFLVCALGGAALLSAILKELFGRPRPELPGPLPHIFEASFPSGHALRSLALFGGLAWLVWRLDASPAVRALTAVCAGAAVLFIGASRVYLGVHFPSDVVAGFLLAGAWLAVCAWAARWAGGVERRFVDAAPPAGAGTPSGDAADGVAPGSERGREP